MQTKRLQVEHGILTAVVIGAFDLGEAQRHFVQLLDEVVPSGATKVLIDGRQMTGNPREYERFLYGHFSAWATLQFMREHSIRLRFAYVIHEPLRDAERFGETVAVNRGMDVKTFEGTNEAILWLNRTE